MSINPMQSAHDAPRCKAKSKRTGLRCRSPAVMAIPSAACMGPAAVRRKGKATGIFGMAAVRGESSKQRVSSPRWPVSCEAVRTDRRFVAQIVCSKGDGCMLSDHESRVLDESAKHKPVEVRS
jgi:hypothetical protein